MPARQKKLTAFSATVGSPNPCQGVKNGQRRLDDLKKVVYIKGGAHNFDVSEIKAAKAVLEDSRTTESEILQCLRRLSCLQITRQMLMDVTIGSAIRGLKQHSNTDIARIAAALVDKWKAIVIEEQKRQAAKP